jgi:RNA polymerase sigma-70 factor (ECF subfamily)
LKETRTPELTIALIGRVVGGERQAVRQLVAELTPVIRTSVSWMLSRVSAPGRREARQEVEDITQTVLLTLFSDRGRALLQWDPSRGLELESFVGLLAKRETVSILRSRRRSPWTEDPTLQEDLDQNAVSRSGPESETISRDMLTTLANAVRQRVSPRGVELFDLMFLKGHQAEDICEMTGLSAEAVYQWRSRLMRTVREITEDLGTGAASERIGGAVDNPHAALADRRHLPPRPRPLAGRERRAYPPRAAARIPAPSSSFPPPSDG